MKIRTRKRVQKQEPASTALGRVRQLLMPMVAGMAATKKDLMSWVQDVGLEALKEVLAPASAHGPMVHRTPGWRRGCERARRPAGRGF
jgi:hypothetical protein